MKRTVPTLDLSAQETKVLAEVLTDYVSDLRMEIANTDSLEVRDELKEKEALLKSLLSRLAAAPNPALRP
jgi:hypothetical protein